MDTETTGFTDKARIIEAAVVTIKNKRIQNVTSSVFCISKEELETPDAQKALEVNGVNPEDVLGAESTIKGFLLEHVLLSDAFFVAHNAEFDLRMFEQEVNRLRRKPTVSTFEFEFKAVFDTMLLDVSLDPGVKSRKLIEVAKKWNVPLVGAHRALGDTLTCANIFIQMLDLLPKELEETLKQQDEARQKWKRSRSTHSKTK